MHLYISECVFFCEKVEGGGGGGEPVYDGGKNVKVIVMNIVMD